MRGGAIFTAREQAQAFSKAHRTGRQTSCPVRQPDRQSGTQKAYSRETPHACAISDGIFATFKHAPDTGAPCKGGSPPHAGRPTSPKTCVNRIGILQSREHHCCPVNEERLRPAYHLMASHQCSGVQPPCRFNS